MTLTLAQLRQIMPTAPEARLSAYLPHLVAAMDECEINTPTRRAAFLAQIAHESAELRRVVENLNYSSDGLRRTWPSRFSEGTADLYARRPEAIANRAYANRMGNGFEGTGDGWRFRGRGLIQVTGASNYLWLGQALGVDLIRHPELLEGAELACRSAAYYWASRGCNDLADRRDLVAITRRINGGVTGLAERRQYWERANAALGV